MRRLPLMKPASGKRRTPSPDDQFHLRLEGKQRRHAVGGRRGVAEIACDRSGVLDLHRADLAAGGLKRGESGRQAGADDVGPGRPPADADRVRRDGDAAQGSDGGEIDDPPGQRPVDKRRVKIGAASEGDASGGKGANRLLDRCRTQKHSRDFPLSLPAV